MDEPRDELLEQARAEFKAKEARSNNRGDYEEVQYFPLSFKLSQIRVLGNYLGATGGDPTSPKQVSMALVMNDAGKWFRWIFPDKNEEANYLGWRILNKVLTKKKGSQTEYVNSHFRMFNQVRQNGTTNPYNKGWEPGTFVCMNVIAREAMQWHKDNKHSLVLTKRTTVKDDKSYSDIGVAYQCWKHIFNSCIEDFGHYKNYDIMVQRLPKGASPTDPVYQVYHAGIERERLIARMNKAQGEDKFKYFEEYATAPLTQEELSWDRYNFDAMYKVTDFKKIHDNLKLSIQQLSLDAKMDWADELAELAAKDQAAYEAKRVEENNQLGSQSASTDIDDEETVQPNLGSVTTSSPAPVQTPAPAARPSAAPAARPSAARPAAFSVDALDQNAYKGIKDMTVEEKALVTGVDANGGFIWQDRSGKTIYECQDESCKFMTPEDVHVCAKCGLIFT